MATQTGIKVNFGFTGTDGIAATGLTGAGLFVSADYEPATDEKQLMNAAGDLATRVFHNLHKKATIEWIPGSATDVATAITNQTTMIALFHTIINITACASKPELIDSHWLVVGVKATGSNTDASKISLTLEQHAGITATPA
jgi:hypothetical protein